MRGCISAPVAVVRKRRSLDEVAIGCDRRRRWYLTVQFSVSVLSTFEGSTCSPSFLYRAGRLSFRPLSLGLYLGLSRAQVSQLTTFCRSFPYILPPPTTPTCGHRAPPCDLPARIPTRAPSPNTTNHPLILFYRNYEGYGLLSSSANEGRMFGLTCTCLQHLFLSVVSVPACGLW
jgi:hypothetical protein